MRRNRLSNLIGVRQLSLFLKRRDGPRRRTLWDWINFKSAVMLAGLLAMLMYVITYYELKGQTCIYEYTNVPDELKKKGFTDDLLTRTINDILYKINTYTDDIRSDLTRPKINYTSNSNPSYVSSIQNMNIEGVPFKALIHFTDKILRFGGANVNENYVSLDFYTTPRELHAAVLYKGIRREFTEHFDSLDSRIPLYNLCYNISIAILEQSHQLSLAEYYFNIDEFDKCIKECMVVVSSEAYTDAQKSRAYLFWGLSLNQNDYFKKDHSADIDHKFQQSIKLDKTNYDARLVAMNFDPSEVFQYEDSLRELIDQDPISYPYWARLMSLEVDTTNCESYIRMREPLYLEMKEKLKDTDYPSDIYWRYGTNLLLCGDVNPVLYDSAISKFSEAIRIELHNGSTDLRKLSYYYNSTAYAYEAKAVTLSGNRNNVCLIEFKKGKEPLAQKYLAECHSFAQQALAADSMNAFAWSTLGEYYGFQFMISGNEAALDNFIKAEKKAYYFSFPSAKGYSFETSDYLETEPYCFIRKTKLSRFEEIEKVGRFYGKKDYLKRLRVIDSNPSGSRRTPPDGLH